MLVISNKKMKALDKETRKPEKTELQIELAEIFPNLPKDELNNFIENGLEKTAKYKIDEEGAVKDFIRLMIVVAKDFDQYPKAQEQLNRTDIDPNLSVQLMCELIIPTEWQEAKSFGIRASDRNTEDYVQKEIGEILSS